MSKKAKKKFDQNVGHVSAEEIAVAKQYDLPESIILSAREELKRRARKVRNEAPFFAVTMDEGWDSDSASIRKRMFNAAWLANQYAQPYARKQVPDRDDRIAALQSLIERLVERLYKITTRRERPSGNMHEIAAQPN